MCSRSFRPVFSLLFSLSPMPMARNNCHPASPVQAASLIHGRLHSALRMRGSQLFVPLPGASRVDFYKPCSLLLGGSCELPVGCLISSHSCHDQKEPAATCVSRNACLKSGANSEHLVIAYLARLTSPITVRSTVYQALQEDIIRFQFKTTDNFEILWCVAQQKSRSS